MRQFLKKFILRILAGALCLCLLGSMALAETDEAAEEVLDEVPVTENGDPIISDEEAIEAETAEEPEEDDGSDWKPCDGEMVDYIYQGNKKVEQETGSLEIEAAPFEIYQYTGPRGSGCNAFTVLDAERKIISVIAYPVASKTVPVCICPKGTAYLVVSVGDDVEWDWSELGMDGEEETEEITVEEPDAILWKRNTRLTLSVMGDSISTFKGYIPEGNAVYYNGKVCGVEDASHMWWGIVAQEIGAKISVIDAWSSSQVSTAAGEESAMCMSRVDRLAENGTPDVIIIFGGVNDFNKEVPLGTWAGKGSIPTSGETFREAYAMMLNKIHQAYPLARIYCCTLVACEIDATPGDLENLGGQYQHEFNEAIREIARIMNCEVIELNSCGINSYNLQAYMGDYDELNHWALHPNAAGQKMIAEKVIKTLR